MYTKEEGVCPPSSMKVPSSQHMLESLMPSHPRLVGLLIQVTLTLWRKVGWARTLARGHSFVRVWYHLSFYSPTVEQASALVSFMCAEAVITVDLLQQISYWHHFGCVLFGNISLSHGLNSECDWSTTESSSDSTCVPHFTCSQRSQNPETNQVATAVQTRLIWEGDRKPRVERVGLAMKEGGGLKIQQEEEEEDAEDESGSNVGVHSERSWKAQHGGDPECKRCTVRSWQCCGL